MGDNRSRHRGWPVVVVNLLIVAVVAGAGALVRSHWEVTHTRLVTTHHRTDELTGEFRLLQVTDFHNLADEAQIDSIIGHARSADPNIIALTGDLINTNNASLSGPERLVRGLVGLGVPVYFVDGNHDHWSDEQAAEHEMLLAAGVQVMKDEHIVLDGTWGSLALIFVDDYYTGNGDLPMAVEGAPEGFRFVVTHSPSIVGALEASDIDYAICGHTHGGQVALPFIGALHVPGQSGLPEFSRGEYRIGSSTLFIDSGVGTTGPPVRFLVQSQITLHVVGPN